MTVLPDSIPRDGLTDVTADLNAWLADRTNWPDGIIELPAYGALGCTGQIKMVGHHDFEWHGRGCKLVDLSPTSDRGESHLAFEHCDGFAVRATLVQGTAPPTAGYVASYEAQHGFHFLSCDGWVLSKCRADAVWGDKVYVGMAGPYESRCHDWTVEFLKGGYSHRSGLVVAGGENGVTHDCDWGRVARSGIDLEPNSVRGGCIGLESRGDHWGAHNGRWIASIAGKDGHPGGPVTGVSVFDAQVDEGDLQIDTGGNHPLADWTIDGCTGTVGVGNPLGAVMRFKGVSGTLQVTNNRNGLQRFRPPPPMRMARWEAADGTSWGTTATVIYEGNTADIG